MNYVPDMPEKEDKQPVCFCDVCNGDLYEGNVIYKIDGDNICTKRCLVDYYDWARTGVYKKGDK